MEDMRFFNGVKNSKAVYYDKELLTSVIISRVPINASIAGAPTSEICPCAYNAAVAISSGH